MYQTTGLTSLVAFSPNKCESFVMNKNECPTLNSTKLNILSLLKPIILPQTS